MRKIFVLTACLAWNVSFGQQAADKFKGTWTNDDPATGGITKVEIRLAQQALVIHVWGKCYPQDCDWGETPIAGDGTVGRVHWSNPFAEREQDLTIASDGRLTIVTRTHYKDASGREDMAVTDHMVRATGPNADTTNSPQPSSATAGFAALEHGTLEVWVPDYYVMGLMADRTARVKREYQWAGLLNEFKRDFPGFDLRLEILQRDEYLRKMHSSQPDPPFPDVAFVDDAKEFVPLRNALAAPGPSSGTSRFGVLYNGWWVRFRSARNTAAAEAFMLWLSRSPSWKPWRAKTTGLGAADAAAVQSVSTGAVEAYLGQKRQALSLLMDREATYFDFEHRPTSVEGVEAPLIFGNSRVAFALLSSTAVASGARSLDHWGMVLRKSDEGWKVLLFLRGPLPYVEEVLRSFDGLELVDANEPAPPKVTLLAPANHAAISRYPRGVLEWRSSGDDPPAAYLIEWQMGQPRIDFWSASGVMFIPPVKDATLHTPVPFGAGRQPHRWRIWYISHAGLVSTSEWRTIDFTD